MTFSQGGNVVSLRYSQVTARSSRELAVITANLRASATKGQTIKAKELDAADVWRLVRWAVENPFLAPFGVRISGARICGSLDLATIPRPEDGWFCPLIFERCVFTDQIRLDRGNYQRVSLYRSKFRRLQARDAAFSSTLDLRGVGTPGPDVAPCSRPASGRARPVQLSECSIDLANARIDGDLWLGKSRLEVGELCGDERQLGPIPYALVLRGAEIHGAARLEPRFHAYGGVSIADITIHGDFRAHGAVLTGKFGAALRAQNAHVTGTVFCRDVGPHDRGESQAPGTAHTSDWRRFRAVGNGHGALVFQNASLGRLELQGAEIRAAPALSTATKARCMRALVDGDSLSGQSNIDVCRWWRRERSTPTGLALDLSQAVIRAGVVAGSSGRPASAPETRFFGIVTARSAAITGDVIFTGAKVDARDADWTTELFRRPTKFAPKAYRPAGYALDFRAASIRGLARFDGGFHAYGGATLADATITGDVYMFDAKLEAHQRHQTVTSSHSAPLALSARSLKLSGAFRGGGVGRLSGGGGGGDEVPPSFQPLVCVGGVTFVSAQLDKMDLGGVQIRGGREGLNLSHCLIRGPLYFNPIPDERNSGDGAMHHPLLAGPLRMHDAVVQGDVYIDAAIEQVSIPEELSDPNSSAVVGYAHVQADGLKVHGSLTLRESLERAPHRSSRPAYRTISLNSAQIGRDLNLAYEVGCSRTIAETVEVEGAVRVEGGRQACIDLILPAAKIGQGLAVVGVTISGLLAKGISIAGDVSLRDSRLAGPIEFDRAAIGGGFDLLSLEFGSDGCPPWLRPQTYQPQVDNIARDYAGLFVENARIGGAMRVREFGRDPDNGDPNQGPALVQASVIESDPPPQMGSLPQNRLSQPDFRPHVSLAFAQVAQIDDLSATAWHAELGFVLRGLTYDSLYFDEKAFKVHAANSFYVQNLRMISSDRIKSSISCNNNLYLSVMVGITPLMLMIYVINSTYEYKFTYFFILMCVFLLLLHIIMYFYISSKSKSENDSERVIGRLHWLRQQFPKRNVKLREYYPQPYSQLARVYRSHGIHNFADAVLVRRCRYDAKAKIQTLRTLSNSRKSVYFSRRIEALLSRAFDITFRYGLSGVAAVFTFSIYALVGFSLSMAELSTPDRAVETGTGEPCWSVTYSVMRAIGGFVPRLGPDTDNCQIVLNRQVAAVEGGSIEGGAASHVSPIAIDDSDVKRHPSAYVIFSQPVPDTRPVLPPVDLWSMAWAAYRFIGWIVLSLTILTLTGLFRRFAEH